MKLTREKFSELCKTVLKHRVYNSYSSRYVKKDQLNMLVRLASKSLKDQEHSIKNQYKKYIETNSDYDLQLCKEMLEVYMKEKECLQEFII